MASISRLLYFWHDMLPAGGRCMLSRALNWIRLRSRSSHATHIRRSRQILVKLRAFGGAAREARTFGYIRKVESTDFEELVLSAMEDAGMIVLRNRRYSGDGGVDGHLLLPPWGWIPIQVKRYSSHISHVHVQQFVELVDRRRHHGGIFVHTGRSGGAVYDHLGAKSVLLISGQKLIDLLVHGKLDCSRLASVQAVHR